MVTEITTEDQFKKALAFDGLLVADFYAIWCGPCKAIAPEVEKLSQEYSKAKFIKVDIDQFQSIAKDFSISVVPTFIFLKEGKEIKRLQGADRNALKEALEANI